MIRINLRHWYKPPSWLTRLRQQLEPHVMRFRQGLNSVVGWASTITWFLFIFSLLLMLALGESWTRSPFIEGVNRYWRHHVATWDCSDYCERDRAPEPTQRPELMPQPETPVPHVPQGMAEQLAALVATAIVESDGNERKIKEWMEAFLRLPLRHLPEQEREKLFTIILEVNTSWGIIFRAECYQQRTCTTFDDDVQRFFYERHLKGGDTERVVYNFWEGQLVRALGKTAAYEKSAKYTLRLLETTTPAYEAMYRAQLPKPETTP